MSDRSIQREKHFQNVPKFQTASGLVTRISAAFDGSLSFYLLDERTGDDTYLEIQNYSHKENINSTSLAFLAIHASVNKLTVNVGYAGNEELVVTMNLDV